MGDAYPGNVVGRVLNLVLVAVAAVIVLYLGALSFTRGGELRQKTTIFKGNDQSFMTLGSRDDVLAVTQKLGPAVSDRQQETGPILFRALG